MKIREFDAKVRIGSWIRYKGKVFRVEDIDRRDHAVITHKFKKIRCSEITSLGNDSKDIKK